MPAASAGDTSDEVDGLDHLTPRQVVVEIQNAFAQLAEDPDVREALREKAAWVVRNKAESYLIDHFRHLDERGRPQAE